MDGGGCRWDGVGCVLLLNIKIRIIYYNRCVVVVGVVVVIIIYK